MPFAFAKLTAVKGMGDVFVRVDAVTTVFKRYDTAALREATMVYVEGLDYPHAVQEPPARVMEILLEAAKMIEAQ